MRIVLVTGKGGVGKTTTAAATALAAAARGTSTTVLSTDPAHSLADALGIELGDELTEVAPRCRARQIDTRARMEAGWGEIRDYLRELLDWGGAEGLEAEELSVLPGMDELFGLVDIGEVAATTGDDLLVVDCAPTAETIRLLSLPEVLARYMERLFPVGRRLSRYVGPVVARLAGGVPVADDDVFAATQRLYERLAAVRALLVDPETTSVRLVVNPEKVVVAEARRLATSLALFGYRVDAVVANRVLPAEVRDPWFDGWREVQARQLAAIEADFAPIPVLVAPLAPSEIVGVERLVVHAAGVYGERDPSALLHHEPAFRVSRTPAGWELVLPLPFVGRDEVDLHRVGDELVVTVGPHRRSLLLPDTLGEVPVEGAGLEDGALRIRFAASLAGRAE